MDGRRRGQTLDRLFFKILSSEENITQYNASRFLEAIRSRADSAACVEKIIASTGGLVGLQQAMWSKQDTKFLNDCATPLLIYLQAPGLSIINGGQYLNNIVIKIVDPPFFWNAYRQSFIEGKLEEPAQQAMGWLLQQLCSLSIDLATPYRQHPDTQIVLKALLSSSSLPLRTIGQKIKLILDTCMSLNATNNVLGRGPGGRHDNDFDDFRQILILPTADEVASTEPSFIRPSDVLEDPETEATRVSIHLDNQFRLLREDMLYEMREELQIVLGKKKGFHRGVKITDLYVKGIDCGDQNRRSRCAVVITCNSDIPILQKEKDSKRRKAYLVDHPKFLKHQSLACLVAGTEIIAFPTIIRDEDRLAKIPPEIVLHFEREESTQRALHKLKMEDDVMLIQIDTAIFSYEPILTRLQQANTLPLASELLLWKKGSPVAEVAQQAAPITEALLSNPRTDLKVLLSTKNSIVLDESQAASLISGLTQQVSLLQGPPGTGKSFIGALLAKALCDYTTRSILVVCYTNHALDDILEGLINIGIPMNDMLRLGGKSTSATEPLILQNQPRNGSRNRDQWLIIDILKQRLEELFKSLEVAFNKYNNPIMQYSDISAYLDDELPLFYEAFRIPDHGEDESFEGSTLVGQGGRKVKESYLMERWKHGQDAGLFKNDMKDPNIQEVWNKSKNERLDLWRKWEEEILQDDIREYCHLAMEYNKVQAEANRAFNAGMIPLLKSKRIVGCTTTAAAKYSEEIQAFNPDVLLVEEAGEILESHVLTALGPETSQLILIGDHKQLRPKVNNYLLTVERGDGYDLNRSLFERLIVKRYPHETLTQQHRMRPEISSLIRELTYPELVDAPATQNRPDILGLQDNIIFMDHENLEGDDASIADKRDLSATSSKHNAFEVQMILKIVKYLGQQGYGTDDLVILTPYLGQLQKLRQALKKDNDPILNDLDSHELLRAGLINPAEAKLTKKPIRLATIDNYQGEECDIVLISLTRSNPRCDIGFMFAPERLNVLLSRSRNGLIMIGNMGTFKNSRKGKELWTRLFDQLSHSKHIYDGLPIKCERHPDRTRVIRQPEDFEVASPDGGCDAPCGVLLSCAVHPCPSKCHQLYDHSKMKCEETSSAACPNGHHRTFTCSDGPPQTCRKCDRDLKLAKKKQEREMAENQRRETEQQVHLRRMDELDAEIASALQLQESRRLAMERENALLQKQDDLARISSRASLPAGQPYGNTSSNQFQATPGAAGQTQPQPTLPFQSQPAASIAHMDGRDPDPSGNTHSSASGNAQDARTVPHPKPPANPFPTLGASLAKLEWERQKSMHGVSNQAVDAIMNMTGLEAIKLQILEIMAKIEAAMRQGASLKKERFNVVLLGNPGTGKTTVARHYAQFLASVKVTPADTFHETTGSRLAHEGVDGAKKLLDSVVKSGGGAIFVDEAYQLTSGHNSQGPAVLDFLLAEMENNVGTLVFLLAGYNREMEKFFEHNPGLKSRVPHQLYFTDYKDEELMSIFEGLLIQDFSGRMKVQDGTQGLYSRTLIRRLGRRRGQPGFGNARDLQTIFARVKGRQATRLAKARKGGKLADDFFLTKEDLIGPDPSKAILESKSWNKLQVLIGLKSVKDSVKSLFNLIEENYLRELMEKEPMEVSLNRVFIGSPGTGKTTVAKLYGQILADLGLLSNGEVIVKNPSDFVGAHLGQSESQTKAILANSVGKVLIIDEAYMLYGGGGESSGSNNNQFKTSVIDTIVAEVQNVPGEDRCVLLLGYRDQMLDMFQNVNPGLSRRFKIEDAFSFEDFDDAELLQILNMKLTEQDLDATDSAKKIAIDTLSRTRNRPNFGNAGEVENIITAAKTRCIGRRSLLPVSQRPMDIVFEPEDFDPDCNRGMSNTIAKLFEDIIGYDEIVQKMENYLEVARTCKARDMDLREHIPTNFVFTGPPGTGKTSVARKMGQIFYDMGLLASAEVIECSASDLVGQYVGQTGPKTTKLFEKALGKVLFIDEAYRLGQGHFAQEAIDELVGLMTQSNFKSKLVIILAGYEQDMNHLMAVNAGLSSRFPDQIYFHDMDAEKCLKLVSKELKKKNIQLADLDDTKTALYQQMEDMIHDLSALKDWGNARDMMTLSKELISCALLKNKNPNAVLELSENDALNVLKKMLLDRQRRSKASKPRRQGPALPEQSATPNLPEPPSIDIATNAAPKVPPPPPPASSNVPRAPTPNSATSNRGRGRGGSQPRGRGRGRGAGPNATPREHFAQNPTPSPIPQPPSQLAQRDPGVSDAIWNRLATAIRDATEAERKANNAIRLLEQMLENDRKREQSQKKLADDLANKEANEKDISKRLELQRQREEAKLKELAARAAREKAASALQAKRDAERQKREKEVKAQRKLREMGVCQAGYRWINMGSFYRCAGGSHTVTMSELGM